MAMHCQQIAVGGLTIAVVSENRTKWSSPFLNFLLSNPLKKEAELTVSFGRCSRRYPFQILFDSGTTWSLAKENGHLVFHVPALSSKEPPEAGVFFDASFEEAKMLLNETKPNRFLDSPLAYPFGEIWLLHLLPPRQGFLLHGFGLELNGEAHLFLGSSGEGKTTSARLWHKQGLGQILSDDRVIVRKEGGCWMAYGTPWHGEAYFSSPTKAPLKRLFFLKHSLVNELKPLSSMDALQRVMVRSFHPYWDSRLLGQSMDVATRLVQEVTAEEFGFFPNPSAVDFIQRHL